MRVVEIFIDGFRNIENTRLKFLHPMAVLLSKNNFGKTNIIEGISWGYKFLGLSTESAHQLVTEQVYASIFDGCDKKFTFQMYFKKDSESTQLYRYMYVIGKIEGTSPGRYGFCEEELAYKNHETDADWRYLLKRDPERPNSTLIYKKKEPKTDWRSSFDIGYNFAYMRSFFKYFGEDFATFDVENSREIEELGETYEKIRDIYSIFAKNMSGDVVLDIDLRPWDFSDLLKKLDRLKKEKPQEFAFFTKAFMKLMPEYTIVDLSYDEASDPYLVFHSKRKKKPETVNTLSSGTRRILHILGKVYFSAAPIICLEELENGVHPKLRDDLLNNLMEILEKKEENNPVLIATSHSTGLINLFYDFIDSIYIGLDGYMREEDAAAARFVGFSADGKKKIEAEMEKLDALSEIGRLIYNYDETRKHSAKLRSWLED